MQGCNLNEILFRKAVIETSKKRGSIGILSEGALVLEEVFFSDILYKYWVRHQKKYIYDDNMSWDEVKESILKLWGFIDIEGVAIDRDK